MHASELFDLSGKVAVVTGAGSGFGEGIATRFAAEGAVLIAEFGAGKVLTGLAKRAVPGAALPAGNSSPPLPGYLDPTPRYTGLAVTARSEAGAGAERSGAGARWGRVAR